MPTDETRVLFAFDDPAEPRWTSLCDGVMGGISTASFDAVGPGCRLFHGRLSRAFGGGFATVRSPARALGLGGFRGVRLRLRGDGRTYRFGALEDDAPSAVGVWRTEFATRAGRWLDVEVEFAELVMTVRGRAFPARGPLPPERIRSLLFGVADGAEGLFRLEVGPIVARR